MVLAVREELPAILAVQREAFGRVARAIGIEAERLPPLTETLDDLEALFEAGTVFFSAVSIDGEVVGSVRAKLTGGDVEIGRLVVAENATRRGIGTALIQALERSFPDAERFELFTGAEAFEPLALYEKLGYSVYETRTEGAVALVWLEKRPGQS